MGEKWPLLTISFFSISKAACLWLINMEGYNDRASGNMNLPSVATDTTRESLLYTACMGGQKDVVTALLERRADPTVIEEKSGDTPLHAVVCGEHGLELGPLLLAQGADINAFSGRGFTPLHMAAFHGSLPCCQMLLAHNADPTIHTRSGLLACDVARSAAIRQLLTPVETSSPTIQRRPERTASAPATSSPSLPLKRCSSGEPASTQRRNSVGSTHPRQRVLRERSISTPFIPRQDHSTK